MVLGCAQANACNNDCRACPREKALSGLGDTSPVRITGKEAKKILNDARLIILKGVAAVQQAIIVTTTQAGLLDRFALLVGKDNVYKASLDALVGVNDYIGRVDSGIVASDSPIDAKSEQSILLALKQAKDVAYQADQLENIQLDYSLADAIAEIISTVVKTATGVVSTVATGLAGGVAKGLFTSLPWWAWAGGIIFGGYHLAKFLGVTGEAREAASRIKGKAAGAIKRRLNTVGS